MSRVDDGEELSVPRQRGASVAIGALTALIIGAAALVLGIVPWAHVGVSLIAVTSGFLPILSRVLAIRSPSVFSICARRLVLIISLTSAASSRA